MEKGREGGAGKRRVGVERTLERGREVGRVGQGGAGRRGGLGRVKEIKQSPILPPASLPPWNLRPMAIPEMPSSRQEQ